MNLRISIGLLGCLWLVAWGQPEETLAGLSREQLEQRKAQLKEQSNQLMFLWTYRWKAVEQWREQPLIQSDLPQPSVAREMLLVRIESIRRVDAEVMRYYPDSPQGFPYYELQARVVKTWASRLRMNHIEFPLRAGMTLSLLWIGCKKDEQGYEVPAPLIWETGKEYLIRLGFPRIRALPNSPEWGAFWDNPSLDKLWLVIGWGDCWFSIRGRSVYNIAPESSSIGNEATVLRMPWSPAMRIEEPSAELLRVLDEESAYYRLTDYAQRLQWAKQRVEDRSLPLWQRQRAVLYLYLAYLRFEEEESEKFSQRLKALYPELEYHVARSRVRTERTIEFLTYLQGLSEPLLQAFGLRIVGVYDDLYGYDPAEVVESWVRVVERFLEADRATEVRRSAAWLLEEALHPLYFKEPASWEWLLSYASEMRERSEREKDEVVRVLLVRVWTSLVQRDLDRQIEAIERQLRGR
ncbi:hypothetical protein DCOP10_12036 [Armatimonadetes bacterium DC]|nr:hypothetical protein DCOP10_12036 [Armatimonadetes bacterium DC]